MNRMFHMTVLGDPRQAVADGTTLQAKCGVVWVPTIYGNSEDYPEIPDCPRCFPGMAHYVYRCFNASGVLIYVGCSVSPVTRMAQHRQSSWWAPQIDRTKFTVFPTRKRALDRESRAIWSEHPTWNVRHQDFASYSVEQYREWLQVALAFGAPTAFTNRLKREAAKHHDAILAVAS